MSGHTPGPWKVTSPMMDPNAFDVESEAGLKITRGYWGGNACADARLIAAAPTMLEALREIAKGEGRYSRDPLGHASNTIEDMKALALAAIAKAEGR